MQLKHMPPSQVISTVFHEDSDKILEKLKQAIGAQHMNDLSHSQNDYTRSPLQGLDEPDGAIRPKILLRKASRATCGILYERRALASPDESQGN